MSSIKNILVTGANGQLGSEFKALAEQYPAYHFIFATRAQLAIENADAVQSFFEKHSIHCCINCAAYTAVDKAETEQAQAILINATAVGILAAACKKQDALFIHFSTDYVFDGTARQPYSPDAKTNPVNFYGDTKLQGEKAALLYNDKTIIIRTSWVYSSYGNNFVKTMLRLMAERQSIGVVSDQLGSPTYAANLAAAAMHILQQQTIPGGIYHYCNQGIISWHQFAEAIKELSHSGCTVNAIPTTAYPTPARRPAFSALDTQSIQSTFNLSIPGWKESLQACLQLMR